MEEGSAIVEIFALKLFKKADDADRQGIYDQNVAKLYKASADLMEVTKQFGELSDDVCTIIVIEFQAYKCVFQIIEKQKYAKWRAYEISKAIRLGITPAPVPGLNESSSLEDDTSSSLPIHPQSSTTITTTTTTTTNYSTPAMSDDDLFKEFDSQNTSKFSPQTQQPKSTSTPSSHFSPKSPSTTHSHSTGATSHAHGTSSTPKALPTKATPTTAPVKSDLDEFDAFDSATEGLSMETIMKAQKFAKQAVSALQFNDIQSARNSLKQALDLLQ